MEGYLIIFEVFCHPMVATRRQLAHQVYNRHPPVNEGNGTHSLETWAHEFFCLAGKYQMVALSKSLKVQLQEAGLGRKTASMP